MSDRWHPEVEELSALVDGELGVDRVCELEGHLRECPECARVRDGLLAVQGAIGGLARAEPPGRRAPEAGPARTEATSSRAPGERGRRRALLATAIAALAAGLAVALLPRDQAPAPEAAPTAAIEASDTGRFLLRDHAEYAGRQDAVAHRTAEPRALTRWLRADARIPFDVPNLGGAELLGGRRCTIMGRAIALVFYRYEGRWVSLYGIPLAAGESPDALLEGLPRGCARATSGLALCTRAEEDRVVALVGDLSPLALEALMDRAAGGRDGQRP